MTPRAPRIAALIALLALIVAACAAEPGPADEPAEGPSPDATDDDAGDVTDDGDAADDTDDVEVGRLDGVTTAEDFGDFAAEGLDRWRDDVPDIEDVRVESTADDHEQPVLWLPPDGDGQPLLVVLHSWSTPYQQHLGIPFAQWAQQHGWAMVHPDFRGVFERPEATGSDLAVQDIVDAVDFAIEQGGVDEERVFVVGFSGGGMMSLLMAGRHPDRFAGAAAWVPIYDLVDWYTYNRDEQPQEDYAEQIEASCGGDPTSADDARAECEHRSPSAHLDAAVDAGVPVYIGHGLGDEIVLPSHAVRAFNHLAEDGDRLDADTARQIGAGELPEALQGETDAEHHFGDPDPEVFFARHSANATLVLFDGEHDMAYHPGLEWMARLAAG